MALYLIIIALGIPLFKLGCYYLIFIYAFANFDNSASLQDNLIMLTIIAILAIIVVLFYKVIPHLMCKLFNKFNDGNYQNKFIKKSFCILSIITVITAIIVYQLQTDANTPIYYILPMLAILIIGTLANIIRVKLIKRQLRKHITPNDTTNYDKQLKLNKANTKNSIEKIKSHKKSIITILAFLIITYPVSLGVDTYCAMNYLSKKYDKNISSFEIVKFIPSHIEREPLKGNNYKLIRRYSPLWQVKYNDKIMNVQRIELTNIYFDDYQLEELSNWSTEFLKENIDENISSTISSSYDFYNLAKFSDTYRMQPLTENCISQILHHTNPKINYSYPHQADEIELKELNDMINEKGPSDFHCYLIINSAGPETNEKQRISSEYVWYERDNYNFLTKHSIYCYYNYVY